MASREFTVIVERDEDGFYIGSVPQLRGCHTQAHSLDQLMERAKEAILLCLDDEGEAPETPLELVGIQRVSV